MVKSTKDRWSVLSMQQRADLIKLYVDGGITSLDEIKKDYNSFDEGGPVELPDNIIKRLAYLIGSDYSVSSKGYASWDDIKRILSGKGGYPEFDDDKAMFIFGNILGLPPAEGSNGKDYSMYLKETYPLKWLLGKINEYQGTINPYGSYVIDERDRGLIEELAKKGKGVYLNADSEYSYMADIYDPPPYRNDVSGYHAQFVNTPNGYAISASDLYDFGPDYAGEKYNSEISTKDKILTGLESAALGVVGNPYILRQDNIPIEFINANDATWVEDKKDRIKGFNWALEHGMLSAEDKAKGITLDEKLAKVLETGYIEPAVVTANYKATGGPTEPLYYDDTYIEPAVNKAFNSEEEYNRYKGEQFGKQVVNNRDKLGRKIGKLAWDVAQFHPFLGTALDLAEIAFTEDKKEALPSVYSVDGKLTELINHPMAKTWSRVMGLPDLIQDAVTLIQDFKKPVSQYSNGGNTQIPPQTQSAFPVPSYLVPTNTTLSPIEAFQKAVEQTEYKDVAYEGMTEDIANAWKVADSDYYEFKNALNKTKNTKSTSQDNSSLINISAPNTEIAKFIFGNKISEEAIKEIKRVSELRRQDPYDVLAHMLIEMSGRPLTTTQYYNTHDLLSRQINPRLLDYYKLERDKQLKQFGIYKEGKQNYSAEEILKAATKMKQQRNAALESLMVPESNIDAVALYMMLHGRDFNPAQKGAKNYEGNTITNSYLDMIDSAIISLKENMPDLFK